MLFREAIYAKSASYFIRAGLFLHMQAADRQDLLVWRLWKETESYRLVTIMQTLRNVWFCGQAILLQIQFGGSLWFITHLCEC